MPQILKHNHMPRNIGSELPKKIEDHKKTEDHKNCVEFVEGNDVKHFRPTKDGYVLEKVDLSQLQKGKSK